MRAQPVKPEEQYRLIMECRSSGLTDYQWCMAHGIKPGTFYNWVKRLRKSGCADIPEASRLKASLQRQEIVKIELTQPSEVAIPETSAAAPGATGFSSQVIPDPNPPVLEVLLPGGRLRIPNGTDTALLRQAFLMLEGLPC